MLCERNDDVTYYTLFIACIEACEKVNTPWAGRSIDAACAQRGELACIPEVKVVICRRLVQWKGHTVGLLDSNFSKCERSFFTRCRTASTLLAFKFCWTLHWH